jgi:Tfp pilus assembly protein PilF
MLSVILLLSLAAQPLATQNFFAIVGSVRDDQGHAVSSIRVSLEDENSMPIKTVFADSSGRFQFRGLRAGNYVVRVEPTGLPFEPVSIKVPLESMTNSRINQSTTEDTTPLDITLRRKRSVSGTNGVVFVQVIPPLARQEFSRGASIIDKDPPLGILSLKKAIEIFPDYFDALELLGTQYVKVGLSEKNTAQFESAIPILTRALVVNNKAASSMYALGVAYLKVNQVKQSTEWLQNSIALNSVNPNAYLMLGLAYGSGGSLDQSEAALKKAYEQGGADAADAHLYLAGLYNKREKYGDASRELELYLKEAKGLKDKTQIKEMIAKLKAKTKPSQEKP